MDKIFRKYCEKCDVDTEQRIEFDGSARASILGGKPGELITDQYLALLTQSGELIQIAILGGGLTLESQGETWNGAIWSGRMLTVTNLICPDCGTMNTTAALSANSFGCMTGLALGLGAIAANIWLIDLPWLIEFWIFVSSFALPSMVAWLYIRIRFQANARPFVFDRCQCGSKKADPIANAVRSTYPCARCNSKNVRIDEIPSRT